MKCLTIKNEIKIQIIEMNLFNILGDISKLFLQAFFQFFNHFFIDGFRTFFLYVF
jgi:hypothetical protein